MDHQRCANSDLWQPLSIFRDSSKVIEPAFINMVVVQGCFVVAGNGHWSEDELEDGAKDDSQHAIIPDGGPVRGPVPNRSLDVLSGAERAASLGKYSRMVLLIYFVTLESVRE